MWTFKRVLKTNAHIVNSKSQQSQSKQQSKTRKDFGIDVFFRRVFHCLGANESVKIQIVCGKWVKSKVQSSKSKVRRMKTDERSD